MQTTINGIRINYELTGPLDAPVVVLSHSLATNLTMWDPQVPSLEPRFRVLRFDTRGHGASKAPPGAYALELLAEDVRALLETLDMPRVHFVGLSMGGMIGQVLALRHPEVLLSLVLADTSSRIPPEAHATWNERIRVAATQGMEPHVEPTIERWFTKPFLAERPAVVESVRQMIRATDPRGYIGCCQAIQALNLTDQLDHVAHPTLVLVGEDDPGTPVAASRTIHERIRGSRLVILKSASHLSNIEQAEAFNRALIEFLSAR